ncbi:acyl-CoA dehydrogenase family protein [Jatrophihabitans cynanchi]|jgi:acyl-CoA dehydrogenase|uniref:Acyl-CoA dehydrogenase family protein n=1 Tax=Jatrophihabitans cynanchi TaxID=2944128 RepID=A0ABY7JYQ6_9ACTN|nr:acyl-CoA dehydrogenase family protein [Jatrophihabitans sp. SB3-54]WAX56850.1 acyl-CoA dehydrogenase family protein [Jatrophihabitans sp. SB3-54]
MDFRHSERSQALQEQLRAFLDEHVFPAEHEFEHQVAANRAAGNPFRTPEVLQGLKRTAREQGLWNLFLPAGSEQAGHGPGEQFGAGLSVLDYAPLAELSGRSVAIAPEAMNCSAPDTGNMELLAMFGTEAQVDAWLRPLLAGEIRSCFSMTEPAVASSDATNIALTITRDGDAYVVDGRKWWSTGAMRPECKVAIVMGVSDPGADRHARHSMILVPLDAPGVVIERSTSVFGYDDGPHGGHGVIHYDHVRVPVENLLGPQGGGFMMAQARLGPGRIHHCMRSLGMAERALELMCTRAASRDVFGGPLARQGVVQEWIAESRLAIEQARLLVLKTAWLIDNVGAKGARTEIAAIKVAAPRAASYVVDRAIQVHGGAGVSGDTPLAESWAQLRTLHLADGPDEVHLRSLGRDELRKHAATTR